jgi:hypothetical protein
MRQKERARVRGGARGQKCRTEADKCSVSAFTLTPRAAADWTLARAAARAVLEVVSSDARGAATGAATRRASGARVGAAAEATEEAQRASAGDILALLLCVAARARAEAAGWFTATCARGGGARRARAHSGAGRRGHARALLTSGKRARRTHARRASALRATPPRATQRAWVAAQRALTRRSRTARAEERSARVRWCPTHMATALSPHVPTDGLTRAPRLRRRAATAARAAPLHQSARMHAPAERRPTAVCAHTDVSKHA